jgi:hypothetical protein
VRATFRMRWKARAESASCWQCWRTSSGPISELVTNGVPSSRRACTSRATRTRSRTVAEVCPVGAPDNSAYSNAEHRRTDQSGPEVGAGVMLHETTGQRSASLAHPGFSRSRAPVITYFGPRQPATRSCVRVSARSAIAVQGIEVLGLFHVLTIRLPTYYRSATTHSPRSRTGVLQWVFPVAMLRRLSRCGASAVRNLRRKREQDPSRARSILTEREVGSVPATRPSADNLARNLTRLSTSGIRLDAVRSTARTDS